MKIQLYVTPAISGGYPIIRRLDGEYTLVKGGGTVPGKGYYLTAKGQPCSQEWAAHIKKEPLLMKRADGKPVNGFMYGIPDDVEIYDD